MIDRDYVDALAEHLVSQGIRFDAGLSDAEIAAVERRYRLIFPPDLRLFLQHAVPASSDFPNWRGDTRAIEERLEWPLEGIVFDIENNVFRMTAWGPRPETAEERRRIAAAAVAAALRLVPIYSHRHVPCEPAAAGNPVLSVYQADIIYYGYDLASYFENEFGFPNPYPEPFEPLAVRFWSEIIDAD